MAQQTAVEWLIKKLESQYIKTSGPYDVKIIFGFEDIEQAKAMEKEQIIEAFDIGTNDENLIGKEYYNEIYTDSINASK